MDITSIASSSSGNCHIVTSGGFHLILDCGVPLSRIREALNHDLSKVVGCLVSHSHADHCFPGLSQLERESNIPIYTTDGTKTARGLKNAHILVHRQAFNIGGHFSCVPLELFHDVECFGFLIISGKEKLLYATDTGEINYTIPGLTHLMIEANFSMPLLINSDVNMVARKRISETHLSIDQVCEFVLRHEHIEEIHLMHLSDAHSDAALFKRMVQDVSGVPVFVAGKG